MQGLACVHLPAAARLYVVAWTCAGHAYTCSLGYYVDVVAMFTLGLEPLQHKRFVSYLPLFFCIYWNFTNH